MIRRLILFIFLLISISALAEMPQSAGFASVPDDWLLGSGQNWHYKTGISKVPRSLKDDIPQLEEIAIVEEAKNILSKSSAKAIALFDGNRIVWQGYKLPASSDSRFHSFSVGKTVTSMAIGKAICSNKFSINDLASNLVPDLKGTDLGKSSVIDLLKMSSGTAPINHDSTIMSDEQAIQISEGKLNYLQLIEDKKINSAQREFFGGLRQSGETFDYHSTDPLLLGVILNKTTGTTYAKWVEEQVLIPAGIGAPAIIGQDHFGFGSSDGNVRMTLSDWVRFAIWVKTNELADDCFGEYVRKASHTQISNSIKREGKAFDGYGYLIWTENNKNNDSYWAVGYGGQRIAWNHSNQRMLVAFSNVENYMDDLYWLYKRWSAIPSK